MNSIHCKYFETATLIQESFLFSFVNPKLIMTPGCKNNLFFGAENPFHRERNANHK